MSEAVGSTTSKAFQPSLTTPQTDRVAEQAQAIKARQSEAVANTVQRQAQFSASRAESLSRQAEKLENRATTGAAGSGLGGRVDITV
ncbi:MAG: hypothetical protein K5905_08810 [Roseibium sp.]|uniref:hypothetical protein n=1 Tax=Roseibium sp. TaxID=1936156 RepID=UPI0026226E41|nr:hypothetical protein [Roseibium sp.]MCV0425561.1 hypothetical protein [Roseibium sp.]